MRESERSHRGIRSLDHQSADRRLCSYDMFGVPDLLLFRITGFWRTFGEAVECPCVAFGTG